MKSNLGHAHVAASYMALAKAIIAMETGLIPPTLNYQTPNSNVPALLNGSLKVCAVVRWALKASFILLLRDTNKKVTFVWVTVAATEKSWSSLIMGKIAYTVWKWGLFKIFLKTNPTKGKLEKTCKIFILVVILYSNGNEKAAKQEITVYL